MTRIPPFEVGRYYHVYNRGTDKRTVFESEADIQRFKLTALAANSENPVTLFVQPDKTIETVAREVGDRLIDLCCYCLMPNHFHFLLREKAEGGLSLFMQKAFTSYTKYFNAKHDRSGALFQGRFKARVIKDEKHLLAVISYINLNPVAHLEAAAPVGAWPTSEALAVAGRYEHSSLPDYLGELRPERALLSIDSLPANFGCWPLLRSPTS